MKGRADYTIRRIELTLQRLLGTHQQRPPERRAGFLEARKRLQVARARRLLQLK